jgi:GT2 family glycosyltransferase
MVTRREVLEQTGLMDEITRAYGEEYDWHFRIRQAGWEVVLVPQARLIHLGKGQVQLKLRGMLLIEDRKAILHYFQKHRPAWQVFVVRMAMMIFHGFFGLVWLPFSREKSNTHWQIARIGFHGRWAV